MQINIIEKVNLDEYVYNKDTEKFARVYLDDGTPTRYAVSDRGRVWSEYGGGKLLNPQLGIGGYVRYNLRHPTTKRGKFELAHRLVAKAFCKKVDSSQKVVDHKNAKTTDNRACNLQWLSQSENVKRTYEEFHRKPTNRSKVFAYSITDRTVQYFESITDASIELGLERTQIVMCCNRRCNRCGEYIFGRAEDFDREQLDAMLDNARFRNVGRAVIHILKDGAVERYDCAIDACRKTDIKPQTLNAWLKGINHPRDGSVWEYESELSPSST